jgi:hypothetical protein
MSEFIRTIIDIPTGEITVVPFTVEETAAHLAEQEKIANLKAEAEAKEKSDKAAREALLNKLGITADEAKLLLS